MINETMPKGMITEKGTLYVERKGRLVSAACPYSSVGSTTVNCGEWCPHFGEPDKAPLLFAPPEKEKDERYQMHLSCGDGKHFIFHKFVDLRKVPPAGPQEPDPVDADPADDIGVPI